METTIKGQFIVENYTIRSFTDREIDLLDVLKHQFTLGTIVELSISVKNTGKSMPKCDAKSRYSDKCGQLLDYVTGKCPNEDYHKLEPVEVAE